MGRRRCGGNAAASGCLLLGVLGADRAQQLISAALADPGRDLTGVQPGAGGALPDALARWYADHLGIDPAPTSYDGRPWWQQQGPTVLSPFPADTDAFGSPEQAWILNLRVRDLDAMVARLRAAGIEVTQDSQTYPNGRFAATADPEGNPIQLWEPSQAALQEPPDRPR